jgi:membrane-associated phospholipid phosphatase
MSQRSDRAIWIVIAVVAVAVLMSSVIGPFQIEWASFRKAGLVEILLVSASWCYLTIRKDALLAEALISAAQIIAFAAVAAPLSYVGASAAFPLWDASFAALDHRLGLDWMAWLAIMNTAPLLHAILAVAYASFAVQTTAIVIVLAITGHALRLRIFILSFMLLTLITIAISAVMPAQGVWGYLHLSALDSPAIAPITRDLPLPVFFGLRDGTFRHLVAEGAEGIISFPSLHAGLGLLFIFGLWPVRYVGWLSLLLNFAMIAATPVDGSHYFSDVFAGLIVAALSWIAVSYIVTQVDSTNTNWLEERRETADRCQTQASSNI